MAQIKIDDHWHEAPDAVVKRMGEYSDTIKQCDREYVQLATLHKTEVLKDIGGSLVNKEDYWSEYCKKYNINY